MLRFRSFPVRLARTFILSVPLLLGIADEAQKIAIDQILKHKEGYARTEAVRVTMIPRAGTAFLPQIYGADSLDQRAGPALEMDVLCLDIAVHLCCFGVHSVVLLQTALFPHVVELERTR